MRTKAAGPIASPSRRAARTARSSSCLSKQIRRPCSMNTLMRTLTVLALTSLLYSGSALAGPSFNTDEPLTPANGGEASGPSFNSDSTSPADSFPSTVESPPAEPQPAQEFVESKAESLWLTYSINPLSKRFISSEAGQTEGVELELSLPFTRESNHQSRTYMQSRNTSTHFCD